jgi:hypothetical protein
MKTPPKGKPLNALQRELVKLLAREFVQDLVEKQQPRDLKEDHPQAGHPSHPPVAGSTANQLNGFLVEGTRSTVIN